MKVKLTLSEEFTEQEAKAKKVGLWQDRNPIPPWEFRRRNRCEYLGERLLGDGIIEDEHQRFSAPECESIPNLSSSL